MKLSVQILEKSVRNCAALTASLILGCIPCHAQNESDNQLIDRLVARIETTRVQAYLASYLEEKFDAYWSGEKIPSVATPEYWDEAKRSVLSASAATSEKQLSDKDLKKFLSEWEQLKTKYATEVEAYPSNHITEIRENLRWSGQIQWLIDILHDPGKREYLNSLLQYQEQTTRLLGLAGLVLKVAPDRFLAVSPRLQKNVTPLGAEANDMFLLSHEATDFLIHSNVLQGILPESFDLQGLRRLDDEIHAGWKTQYSYKIGSTLGKTPRGITPDGMSQLRMILAALQSSAALRADINTAIPGRMSVLARRLWFASDKASYCQVIRAQFSEASLKSPWTDWTRKKLTDGSLALQSPEAMNALVDGYSFGCFSPKRDTVTARRLLEAWANQHGDEGRLTANTHCKLASWYGHGIGGIKDVKKSEEWRALAKTQAGVTCTDRDFLAIEPSDPWRELD